jgi:hypothetical protein
MNTLVEDLIAYPQRYFDHPREVLDEPTLKMDEKRRILESWKLDAQRLAESTAENMTGGEETDLREVSKVLVELKQMPMTTEVHQTSDRNDVPAGMAIGGLLGAGAGLLAAAVTGPSLTVIAQATVVGVILGGVVTGVRRALR